jgi:hypothetical protein
MATGMMASQIGCATAIYGTTQEVVFYTDPINTKINVDGSVIKEGRSRLSRFNIHRVEASHPGCVTQTIYIKNGYNAGCHLRQ